MICIAAANASISPQSASDSRILRTRMKRPGINSRLAMACFASAISQGKYCAALISRVTAKSSLKAVVSALRAEHIPPIIRLADECAVIPLGHQPQEIVQVAAVVFGQAVQQVVELPCVRRLAVDLLRRAVFGDHVQQIVDDARVRVEQQRVDRIEPIVEGCAALRAARL